MNTVTKNILINSLNEFDNMNFTQQLEYIRDIKNDIKNYEWEFENVFPPTIGYLNHYKAKQMFLRIAKYKFSKYSW